MLGSSAGADAALWAGCTAVPVAAGSWGAAKGDDRASWAVTAAGLRGGAEMDKSGFAGPGNWLLLRSLRCTCQGAAHGSIVSSDGASHRTRNSRARPNTRATQRPIAHLPMQRRRWRALQHGRGPVLQKRAPGGLVMSPPSAGPNRGPRFGSAGGPAAAEAPRAASRPWPADVADASGALASSWAPPLSEGAAAARAAGVVRLGWVGGPVQSKLVRQSS
jgi:hypothetical protein